MIKKDDPKFDRIQLVIPRDVLAAVKKLAAQERRSMSNMIVVLIEKAMKDWGEKEPGNSLELERAA